MKYLKTFEKYNIDSDEYIVTDIDYIEMEDNGLPAIEKIYFDNGSLSFEGEEGGSGYLEIECENCIKVGDKIKLNFAQSQKVEGSDIQDAWLIKGLHSININGTDYQCEIINEDGEELYGYEGIAVLQTHL